ncbi:pectate lyase-like adhesive domain-containing protein [Weissella kandleri]|uniref:pectate lyase-like adhesive domain-containing protein n=1 Tax=Weissella kandleri TaxID=1616 RepID=UPI00387E2849
MQVTDFHLKTGFLILLCFIGVQLISFDSMAADVKEVTSNSEYRTALADPNVTEIQLKNDLNYGVEGFPVNHSVVINGMGHTVLFNGTLQTQGVYFNANDIEIHYKNINFGRESNLGLNILNNANNYYGIAPQNGKRGLTLQVENVGYYSDLGAQPFYLPAAENQIIFSGTNNFQMMGGLNSQEFAEAHKFTFKANSQTTIVDQNNTNLGFIWATNTALSFNVETNAKVNITTRHDFLYSSESTPIFNLGSGAQLNIKQTDSLAAGTLGRLIYQDNLKPQIQVGQNANISLQTKNENKFSNIQVNLGAGSSSLFNTKQGNNFFGGSSGNIKLDNVQDVTWSGQGVSSTGPIGLVGGIDFTDFVPPLDGYGVYINQTKPALTKQNTNDSWILNTSGFSRNGTDFSTDQKNALKTAKEIKLVGEKNQPTQLSWSSDSVQTTKNFDIDMYDLQQTDGQELTFYWQDNDPNEQLNFQLLDANKQIVKTSKVNTGDGSATWKEQTIQLPKRGVDYGAQIYQIHVVRENTDGSLSDAGSTDLQLQVNVTGSLKLIDVPESFQWSQRTPKAKTQILSRDAANIAPFRVIDSRPTPRQWTLQAHVIGDLKAPFHLKWRQNKTDPLLDLDGQVIWQQQNPAQVQMDFQQTWDAETGVVLETEPYIPIGQYQNQQTVVWTVNTVDSDVP